MNYYNLDVQEFPKIIDKKSDDINNIKKLNPKPAEEFSDYDFRIEPPDVMINSTEKGWKVELNKSTLPTLFIQEDFAEEVKKITESGNRPPHLAAVIVGNDGASLTYVGSKVKACEKVGYESTLIKLPSETTEDELLNQVELH